MKGYFGQTADNYHLTPANLEILLPAIENAIKPASDGEALDVGCGKGDYLSLILKKGYAYTGLDVSEDMIGYAKALHPEANFIIGSATDMAHLFDHKFDLILINMLLLHCETKEEICKILSEAAQLLSKDGSIVVGIPHPCFDSYMRGSLFNQFDVSEKFVGYFASGQKYIVNKHLETGPIIFENVHWTLTDYMECLKSAGLILTHIDECQPTHPTDEIDKEYNIKRRDYPTYLVSVAKKTT